MNISGIPKIIVIGGGAGGLELVTRLGKTLGRKNKAQIILVDSNLTHLWKPLWHEVAAGTLNSNEDEINYFAHAFSHHYIFELGKLDGLDRNNKLVSLAPVIDSNGVEIIPARKLAYDILILAIGSISNDFSIPGVSEYCMFLDSRTQADRFQQHFLKHFMQVQNQPHPLTEEQLNIAIVGGGATGVELAAELHYAINQAIRYSWHNISPSQVQLTIIEAANRLLSALPTRLSTTTYNYLASKGIKIFTGERVMRVTADGIYTQNGLYIPARLKAWAAGIKAPEILKNLDGLEINKLNQLIVRQTLQTTNDDNIFAFGDCASCPQPNANSPVPPRAQAAHQQASLLVKSLNNYLVGKPCLNYRYKDYGSLISLSRKTAVGNLMGGAVGSITIQGKLAKLFYISLYKMHQIALFGWWRATLLSIAELLTRRVKPKLKLH